jgi:hypothetical protein
VGQTLQATLTRNSLRGNNSPISSITTSLGKRKPVQKTAPKKSEAGLFVSTGLSTKPIFPPANAKASPAGRTVASRWAAQPNPVSLLPMPRHPPQHDRQQVDRPHNPQQQQPHMSKLWWHLPPILPLLLSVLALMMMRPVVMMTGTMEGT